LNLIRVMPAKGQDSAMPTSTFLARLIGPVLLIAGLGVFTNRATFRAMAEESLHSPALLYLSGLLVLPAGLAIVLTHNVWQADWRVIITVLGWLLVISGAVRILVPAQVRSLGELVLRHPVGLCVAGGLWLGFGVVLCFFGYFR
jgi:hypothetical protein